MNLLTQIKQEPGTETAKSSACVHIIAPATGQTSVLSSMLNKVTPAPLVVNSMPGQAAIPRLAYVLQQKANHSSRPGTVTRPPGNQQTVYLVPSPQNNLPANKTNIFLTNATTLVPSTGMPAPAVLPPSTPLTSTVPKASVEMNTMRAGKDTSLVAITSNIVSTNNPSRTVCGLVYNAQQGDGVRKEFLCNFCQFKVGSYATFNIHLAGHIFKCRHCSYKAFTRYEVITHRQEQHPQFRHELSGYEGVKLGEGPNSIFSNATTNGNPTSSGGYFTYKIHEYSGHEKMYECSICLYMTHELYNMYDHATTHTIEDMNRGESSATTAGWACYFCSFTSNQQADMISHLKLRHADQPLKLRRLTHKAQSSSETLSTTMWGCYYCPNLQTETRENAVRHVQENHRGQKLMITRRRIVPAKPPSQDVDTGPELTLQIEDTRSLSQADQHHSHKKASKYSDMISFLNDSNKAICEQLEEASKDKHAPKNLQTSTVIDNESQQSTPDEISTCNDKAQVGSELSGFADVIYDPVPSNDVQIDLDRYMTMDRVLQRSICKMCGHTRNGKHAFSHMREHIMLHTGERVWGCPYCNYVGNRRIAMYNHVRVRHAELPVRLVRRKPYTRGVPPRLQIVAGVQYRQRMPSRLRGPRSIREARILRDATQLYSCTYCTRSSVFQEEITEHMTYAHPAFKLKAELVADRPSVSEQLKEAVLQLVRLEDMHRYNRLRKLLNPVPDEEEPVLPNSTESGKYQCPYCSYRTVRPLIVKQHILCRHPDSEVVVTDLRVTSKRGTKMLYLCALRECKFVTPVKHALYAHLGKNPLHAGVLAGELKRVADSDRPLGKISLRCSSLRSAAVSFDPLVNAMKEELASDLPSSGLLLKCCYCDLPATYDCVVMKNHFESVHAFSDPVAIDVRAQLQQLPHRLLICPVKSCETYCHNELNFIEHLKQVHAEMTFHLPVIDGPVLRPAKKTRPYKRKTILESNTAAKKSANRYCCWSCRYRGPSLDLVRKHLVEKHGHRKSLLMCTDRRARVLHKKCKIYFCRTCSFNTRLLYDMQHHACELVYLCSSCDCQLSSRSSMEEHVLREHACQTGGYSQINASSGAFHETMRKTDDEERSCGITAVGVSDSQEVLPSGTDSSTRIDVDLQPENDLNSESSELNDLISVKPNNGIEVSNMNNSYVTVDRNSMACASNDLKTCKTDVENDHSQFDSNCGIKSLPVTTGCRQDQSDGGVYKQAKSANVSTIQSKCRENEEYEKYHSESEIESESEERELDSETESGFEGENRSDNEAVCIHDGDSNVGIGDSNNDVQDESEKACEIDSESEKNFMSDFEEKVNSVLDISVTMKGRGGKNSNDIDISSHDSSKTLSQSDNIGNIDGHIGRQATVNRENDSDSVSSSNLSSITNQRTNRDDIQVEKQREDGQSVVGENDVSVSDDTTPASPQARHQSQNSSEGEESSLETSFAKPVVTGNSNQSASDDEDGNNDDIKNSDYTDDESDSSDSSDYSTRSDSD